MDNLLVSDIIQMAKKQLSEAGIKDAKLQAEQIYCRMKKLDKMKFFIYWSKEAGENEAESYFRLVSQRAARKPLQLIFGETEFMGYIFKAAENVLIPRMDTEVVVEEALRLAQNKDSVLDLCCGCGVIAISMMRKAKEEKKSLKMTAVDISKQALELTQENAKLNDTKIDIVKSDLFEALKKKRYDLIVSNPPYIKTEVIATLEPEVKDYDPLMALDGGADGLDFYKRIIEQASQHLKKNGKLVLEIGNDQAMDVSSIIAQNPAFDVGSIAVTKDLAGNDRVISCRVK